MSSAGLAKILWAIGCLAIWAMLFSFMIYVTDEWTWATGIFWWLVVCLIGPWINPINH